jgi:hypothetical protein
VRTIFLILIFALAGAVHGEELLRSSTPAWRCYTGIAADGHSNQFTSVDYQLRGDFLREHEPEPQDAGGFRWIPIMARTRVTTELIAVVHGKTLYRALYYSGDAATPRSGPEVAVFLLTTAEGHLRPFCVLFPDETESFESYLESSSDLPFSLTARTNMSGTGAFFSIYSFSFPKGLPRFLGRTDGGRHNEAKTYK